jgi:hypothetical protein
VFKLPLAQLKPPSRAAICTLKPLVCISRCQNSKIQAALARSPSSFKLQGRWIEVTGADMLSGIYHDKGIKGSLTKIPRRLVFGQVVDIQWKCSALVIGHSRFTTIWYGVNATAKNLLVVTIITNVRTCCYLPNSKRRCLCTVNQHNSQDTIPITPADL